MGHAGVLGKASVSSALRPGRRMQPGAGPRAAVRAAAEERPHAGSPAPTSGALRKDPPRPLKALVPDLLSPKGTKVPASLQHKATFPFGAETQ